jgi:uncharacterized Fe-S cluster protein YjdI
MAAKAYRHGDVVVTYDPDLCIHAAECVRGLPEVFDTQARPWIRPERADPEDLRAVVGRCPSGALQFERVNQVPPPQPPLSPTPAAGGVTVTVKPNGPLLVQGACRVVDPSGSLLKEGAVLALCRCGQSTAKPFCDGTHGRVGWRS